MSNEKRPPHPATVPVERAPHLATVQRKEVPFGMPKALPPHPATMPRVTVQPKVVKVRAPHAAMVQRREVPLGGMAGRSPHPATLGRGALPDTGARPLRAATAVQRASILEMDCSDDKEDVPFEIPEFLPQVILSSFTGNFNTYLQAQLYVWQGGEWKDLGKRIDKQNTSNAKHAEENLLDALSAMALPKDKAILCDMWINNSPCGNDEKKDHDCTKKLEAFATNWKTTTGQTWTWQIHAANFYKHKKNPKRYENLSHVKLDALWVAEDDDVENALVEYRAKQAEKKAMTEDDAMMIMARAQEMTWKRAKTDEKNAARFVKQEG